MKAISEEAVLRAHRCLMRARTGLWAALALAVLGGLSSLMFSWNAVPFIVAAGIAYLLSLGLLAQAGNAIGGFGLKYVFSAVAGASLLSAAGISVAAFLVPVGVFLWAKHEVGAAFRSRTQAQLPS